MMVSLPVYDLQNAVEVVRNIQTFTKAVIVLHNNALSGFTNDDLRAAVGSDVIINSERLAMECPHFNSPHSLWDITVSNIKACAHLPWNHIVLFTSNSRFVRRGVDEYLKKCPHASGISPIPAFGFDTDMLITDSRFPHDNDPRKCRTLLDAPCYYYGNVDGAYLRRDVAKKLLSAKVTYTESYIAPQEIIVPTICAPFSNGSILTYTDWTSNMNVTPEIVYRIRMGHFPDIFAVKRVNMDNHDLRKFICSLSNA